MQNKPEIFTECTKKTLSSLQKKLIKNLSDILYSVTLANKKAYLYLLAEHQSTPDKLMPYRILKYEISIWSDHLKQFGGHELPLIVTTVFYNGKEPYTYSTDFKDLLNAPRELIEEVWRQPFRLVDAHDISDEALREHKWYGVLAFFMRHVYARDFLPYLRQSLEILKAIESENDADYVVTLLNYILMTAETEYIEGFVDTVKQSLSKQIGNKVMTIAEQLIQRGEKQGLEKGILQGMQQGMQQGEKEVLLRQLTRRFSIIPDAYVSALNKASSLELLALSDRVLDAKSLEEIFEDIFEVKKHWLTTAETEYIEGFMNTVKQSLSKQVGNKVMTIAEL